MFSPTYLITSGRWFNFIKNLVVQLGSAMLLILILAQARATAMAAEECEALAVWSVATLCRELSLQNVRDLSGLLFIHLVHLSLSLQHTGSLKEIANS